MPTDTIALDIMVDSQGWQVCNHQSLQKDPPAPEPISDFILVVKSQPAYISQYYKNIKCELPDTELYKTMKKSPMILMATSR